MDHSPEDKEDLERLAVEREATNQTLEKEPETERKPANDKCTTRSLSSSDSEREVTAEPGDSSQHKARQNQTPNSLDDLQDSQEKSDADDYTSESESTNIADIMPEIPLNMRDILNRRLLFTNDKEARTPGDPVIKKAMAIIDRKRGSDWSEEKQHEVKDVIEDYAEEAEATFVLNLMSHILGTTRKVPKHTTLS